MQFGVPSNRWRLGSRLVCLCVWPTLVSTPGLQPPLLLVIIVWGWVIEDRGGYSPAVFFFSV